MHRLFVSLRGAALCALVAGPVGAQPPATRERPRLDTELAPVESPEAFDELWNRFGGDGALDARAIGPGPADQTGGGDRAAPTDGVTATAAGPPGAPTTDRGHNDPPAQAESNDSLPAEANDSLPAVGTESQPAGQAATSQADQTNDASATADAPHAADTADAPHAADDQVVSPRTTESGSPSTAETAESDGEPAETGETEPVQPRGTLSPEMRQLRDRVRYRLGEQMRQDYNASSNTATDVLYYCLGFGRRAGVRTENQAQPLCGIGCLCFNYSFRGHQPLTIDDDQPAARVGYGRQAYPSQMLAVLAQACVPPSYPVRVGELKATVGDLVEQENRGCRDNSDLSLKLVGLSYYVASDATWLSSDGETWSLDRVIRAEMDRPFTQASGSGVHRLMGLSYAVKRRTKDELPIDGGFGRAERYLLKFHDHALQLQNADGSWHPKAFGVRGVSQDTAGTLRATGMILDWLVYSLPEEKLDDPRVVKSVACLTRLLATPRYATGTPQLPTGEIAGVMHAVHALRLYDERVFQPADPPDEGQPVAGARGSHAVR